MIKRGEVIGMTYADERQFLSRYERFLLIQHHRKKFYYLFDAMVRVNPDLQKMLDFARRNVSERWAKNIRGRVIGDMLIRYLYFSLHPQQFAFKGFLVLYANYFYIQQYLQRLACVFVNEYGFEDKHHNFTIKKNNLLKLSKMWAKDMLPYVEEKIVPAYHKRNSPEYQKLSPAEKRIVGRWGKDSIKKKK